MSIVDTVTHLSYSALVQTVSQKSSKIYFNMKPRLKCFKLLADFGRPFVKRFALCYPTVVLSLSVLSVYLSYL